MEPGMKNLRRYIRKILKEAMVNPNALSDDFAVWSNWYEASGPVPSGTELNFILYNMTKAQEGIDELTSGSDEDDFDGYDVMDHITTNAFAAIRARVPNAGHGDCNSAWEVIRSAAEKGYGPTLYDLVMSISPYGLTSDRSEVSQSARSVWSYYANNRDDVDKQLLDPNGVFTWSEEDDCTMQGSGSTWTTSPLPKLHRQMAVDFLEEYYPVEYEEWLENEDPQQVEYLKGVDGNDYWEAVSDWIESEADSREYEEWEVGQANDEWFDWKMENEPNLIDNLGDRIDAPQQLNISYNTGIAEDAMIDLINNHWNFQNELEERLNGTLGLDEESLTFSVRDFFNEKYEG